MLLRTLDRGLALLEWIASHPDAATARGAASALDMNINSCYHLVNTLASRGYVNKTMKGKLTLGPAVFELWSWFLRHGTQEDLLIPTMKELHERVRETVHLLVWDGSGIEAVAATEGPQMLTVSANLGDLGHPAFPHLISGGRTILAYLQPQQLSEYLSAHELVSATPGEPPLREEEFRAGLAEVAANGLGSDLDAVFPGMGSMAAPFFNVESKVVGALAVSMPAIRYEPQKDRVARELFAAAEKASRRLGYRGPYPSLRPAR